MVVQLNNEYDGLQVASIEQDLHLLKSCDESDLDVVIHVAGISLKKLSFFEKFINFFKFGASSERLKRLAAYMDRACHQNAIPLMSDHQIQFYQSLRKWKRIDSGSCANILKIFFASKFTSAKKVYEESTREYTNAKLLYLQARRDLGDDHPSLVDLEKRLLLAKMMRDESCWKYRVAETELARERGAVLEKSGKGVTGTQFGKGLDNSRLTVVKMNSKDPRFFNERFIPNHRSQEQLCRNDPRQAEAVAFLMSQIFGFDIVPPTYLDENGYSVQLFDSRGSEAHRTNISEKTRFSEDELELLQIMALFNYLTGDLDGKDDNWKIVYNGDRRIVDIVKFDNGNSFPELPVEKRDFMTLEKTYAWKKHKWAQMPILTKPGSKMGKILSKIFDPRLIDHFQGLVQSMCPGFFSEKRKNFMLSRLATIKAVAQLNRPMSDLGNVYGPEHFELDRSLGGAILKNLNEQYFADFQNPNIDPVFPRDNSAVPNEMAEVEPLVEQAAAPRDAIPQEEARIPLPQIVQPMKNLAQQAWGYTSWVATPVISSLSWVRDKAVAHLLSPIQIV